MFNLGWTEVAIVLLVAVVIFGPKKLPQLGGSFGKTIKGFKEGLSSKESDNNDNPNDRST